MRKRATTLLSIIVLGLMLAGCSKCGWIWNDYGPRACRTEAPKR
jgi:hypothetical protein